MTLRRRIASGVAALAGAGLAVALAIGQVATDTGESPRRVLEIVRTTRYALFNACSAPHPLCADVASVPDDVVCIPVRCDAEGERERDQLLAAMGVRLSALPAILAWVPPHQIDDGEGGRVRVPASWREYRVADLPRSEQTWKAQAPDVDERTPELSRWVMRNNPPALADVGDAAPQDERTRKER